MNKLEYLLCPRHFLLYLLTLCAADDVTPFYRKSKLRKVNSLNVSLMFGAFLIPLGFRHMEKQKRENILIASKICFNQEGKMTDMKTRVFERWVYYLPFPRGGGTAGHKGPHEEAPRLVRRQREPGESMGRRFSFPGKNGWGRYASLSKLRIVWFEEFQGFFAVGMVSSCLVPGSGEI